MLLNTHLNIECDIVRKYDTMPKIGIFFLVFLLSMGDWGTIKIKLIWPDLFISLF